jgi:hypothetical protein
MQGLIEETPRTIDLVEALRICIEASMEENDSLSLVKCVVLGISEGIVWDRLLSIKIYQTVEEQLPIQHLFTPYGETAVPILFDLVESRERLPRAKLALAFQLLIRYWHTHKMDSSVLRRITDDIRMCNEYYSADFSDASLFFSNCITFLSANGGIDTQDKLYQPDQPRSDASVSLLINDILERDMVDCLPEHAGVSYAFEPLVRKGEKIGRNMPCPCGSGKKYKQCCLKKANSIETTYISAHEKNFLQKEHNIASFSTSEILDLAPYELKRLEIQKMNLSQLAAAWRVAERHNDYGLAMTYLTELRKYYVDTDGALPTDEIRKTVGKKKATFPKGYDYYDDYVDDFVSTLQFDNRLDLIEKTMDLFFDRAHEGYKLAQFLDQIHKRNSEQILRSLESYAFEGITKPGRLSELFYALEDHYPGLSIAVFRSIVGAFPERIFDIDTMIDDVSDLVVKHNIEYEEEPSFQTFYEHYELRNEDDTDASHLDEIKELQRELRQVRIESSNLQKHSGELNKKLNTALASETSGQTDNAEQEADPADERKIRDYEERIASSKSKILHLQEIIRSKQDSIHELKREVSNSQAAMVVVERKDSEYEDEIDISDLQSTVVLIPEYDKDFKKSLDSVESSVSKNALRAVMGFATKDERYLKQTKRLKSLDDYYSIRIGIHYRLILEHAPNSSPVARYLIHRKDLESVIRRIKEKN